jgi:hypothetical protein
MHKITALLFAFIGLVNIAFGQAINNPVSENPGTMASHGKIYVVLLVCLVILSGLIGYLILLDRKISRLEKNKD